MLATGNASLEEEIEAWLQSSACFDELFPVPRHLSPQWFIINELLLHARGDGITFRNLLAETPSDAFHRGRSPNQRLSVCLNALRVDMKMLSISEGGKEVENPESSFPVTVTIKITKKMEDAARKYSKAVLRNFYGRHFADEFEGRLLDVMATIYEFATKTFINDWPAGITALVSLSGSAAVRKKLHKEMIASSEYFALIHILWRAKLQDEDSEGFTRDRIRRRAGRIRSAEDVRWDECIDILAAHEVLESVSEECLRLGDAQAQALSDYGSKLITYRSRLRSDLEKLLPSVTPGARTPLP
jgi:hypothetical protein